MLVNLIQHDLGHDLRLIYDLIQRYDRKIVIDYVHQAFNDSGEQEASTKQQEQSVIPSYLKQLLHSRNFPYQIKDLADKKYFAPMEDLPGQGAGKEISVVGDMYRHQILPMFAALEVGRIRLAKDLSVSPKTCPLDQKEKVFTMTEAEIEIVW